MSPVAVALVSPVAVDLVPLFHFLVVDTGGVGSLLLSPFDPASFVVKMNNSERYKNS
jgi:hypothetical protein